MTGEPCVHCGAPARDTFLGSPICEGCIPASDADAEPTNSPERSGAVEPSEALDNETETQDSAGEGAAVSGQNCPKTTDYLRKTQNWGATGGEWAEADFTAPESGIWSPELLEREQWMGHVEKKPFAPWADRDHPEADADEDARWKWGLTENYVDGKTVTIAEDDPRLDGRAFLQQPDDPFAYVDGDDVRDPESGAVHPAFVAILEHLGLTYADVSQSGAGVHAVYRGELPDGVKQAAWQLDTEPWGANDDLPSIEIYPGKRVCVMTGEHVVGTPTEVREWNADIFESLLEANDEVAARQRESLPTAREVYDLDDYEPQATTAAETTDDVRDIFAALDRLDARQVAAQTIVHRWTEKVSTSDGKRAFAPTWGRNANGTANIVDERLWQDTGDEGGYGGPVVMALIDAGELSHRRASPRIASGSLWCRGVEHLRELGFDVPAYDPSEDAEDASQVAALPDSPSLPEHADGWNWRRADAVDDSVEGVRERTTTEIADVIERGGQVLLEALPTLGKSYGSIEATSRTGEPVTILTTRGRKEQYDQLRKWALDRDLTAYTLPAFTHDCDTANGEHGADWRERVMDWYRRGATPKEIHKHAETELGHPLPCQQGKHTCPYTQRWDFDPEEFDVLLGHYAHAHKRKVTVGRTVIVDEFPGGAYETCLDHGLEGAISYFLKSHDALPFDDYTDLIEGRHDDHRRADALLWFQEHDLEPDGLQVFGDQGGHAAAPQATFTILASAPNHLGNGWERAPFGDGSSVGLFNREQGRVWLLTPPEFDQAAGLLGLDGTPTKDLWDLTMGTHLEHRLVLDDDERQEYLTERLGLKFIRTTDAIKPYNNSDHVALEQDAALIAKIREQHGQRPDLITTSSALDKYNAAGLLDDVDEVGYYGNVLGSNEFAESRLGVVIGSNHYGDGYVKKWAAYAGATAERGDEKGSELTYGAFGDQVLTHMREHDTLQAALRFGRDGNGAVVYVHTDTLPEWVPLAGEGQVLTTWSDGMRQVLAAAEDLGEWTTAELAAHPDVTISERQVRAHLTTLVEERGVLERETDGCGYVWRDDGLHRVSEYGDVELAPIKPDALSDAESAELARRSYYTWDFRTSGATSTRSAIEGAAADSTPAETASIGGDPHPAGPNSPLTGWSDALLASHSHAR